MVPVLQDKVLKPAEEKECVKPRTKMEKIVQTLQRVVQWDVIRVAVRDADLGSLIQIKVSNQFLI